MKTLLLMRHAKSSWDEAGLADHDRPLNERGKRTAPLMADWLQQKGLLPDRIICSSAVRTRQTAAFMAEAYSTEPAIYEELYLAQPGTWRQVLAEHLDVDVLLAIGHNSGIEEIVERVAGEYHKMPTAAIAWFQYDGTSPEFSWDALSLLDIWKPKEIVK